MSLFQSPERLASTNGGAISFTVVEQPPDQGAISGRPGRTGLAIGDTIFTIRTDPRYVVFSESYFRVQGHFTKENGTTALPNNAQLHNMAYCDNWTAALFQTARVTLNGSQIEQALFVPQTDTVATYSAASHTWLKSYGTASGVGESAKVRINASGAQPRNDSTAANYGECVATFRPPLSLWNCPTAIRGNQWRVILSWAPNAEQQMVESFGFSAGGTPVPAIAGGTTVDSAVAVTGYNFFIDNLTMFVATAQPDPGVSLPRRVLIDLTPCQTTLVNITGSSGASTNVSIPPTTFRMAFAWQDANTNVNNTTCVYANGAGLNGINPITSFALGFSVGTSGAIASPLQGAPAWLTAFRWSSAQLGLSWPIPDYSFSTITGGATSTVTVIASRKGLERAYRDFIQTTQGDHSLNEGAMPFGNLDTAMPINALGAPSGQAVNGGNTTTTTTFVQSGSSVYFSVADIDNPNATDYLDPALSASTTVATASTTAVTPITNTFQASFGWLGRYPILAAPVVKPVGTNLSQIDVTYSFSTAVTAVNMYVFAYYGAAVAIEYGPDGSVTKVEVQQNV